MIRSLAAPLLVVLVLAGCGKNPLAPPGLLNFGTGEASVAHVPQGAGGKAPLAWIGSTIRVQWYAVTINRVDISEDGTTWIPVLTQSVTLTAKAGVAEVAGSTVGVRPGEYHGVRVWFGSTLHAVAKPPNVVYWTPDEPLTDFDRYNPRVFTTRDGSLAFPFNLKSGEGSHIFFGFDFTDAWKFTNDLQDPSIRPFQAKLVLDRDPDYYPKVTVRLSKFEG